MKKTLTSMAMAAMLTMVMGVLLVIGRQELAPKKAMGTSASIMDELSKVENYIYDKYSDYKDIDISLEKDKYIDTKNYNQDVWNNWYYLDTGIKAGGTCTVVATASLLEYCGNKYNISAIKDRTAKPNGTYIIFCEIIDNMWFYGHATSKQIRGVSHSRLDSNLTQMFTKYGSSLKGNNDYYDIYDSLKSEVNSDKPVLFSMIGHTTVGAGYVEYEVEYTKKYWWGKQDGYATEKFIVVNDGWTNSIAYPKRQYSYFPEREIDTGIYRYQFGITKVK
ncbi:MAG: hypothetical protein E7252_05660 [Lachnospira sp.]|nr:hypothetical protein [Lachnospira sp.]